jgi:ribosome maturation factor RimP
MLLYLIYDIYLTTFAVESERGLTQSPLFIMMQNIEQQIWELAEKQIESPAVFVVETILKGDKGGQKKVIVYLDGDEGVSIDECSRISRGLGNILDENNIIEGKFILEVSSYGVGRPLKVFRQFKNNVGRKVKVELNSGKSIEGKLVEAHEDKLVLEKKKKKDIQLETVEMKDINKTQVLVSFN